MIASLLAGKTEVLTEQPVTHFIPSDHLAADGKDHKRFWLICG
jgi:hypothetical protein